MMITDKQRLDFLQNQLGEYSGKVICRDSVRGRGWRLHETELEGAVSDVREAIDNYMEQVGFKVPESEIDKWISVKDRLPENGKRVLAFSYLEDLDVIFIYRWDKYWESREITHWQPLPNPPESEGK